MLEELVFVCSEGKSKESVNREAMTKVQIYAYTTRQRHPHAPDADLNGKIQKIHLYSVRNSMAASVHARLEFIFITSHHNIRADTLEECDL